MAENETGEKVDFSGTKATDPEKNKWSRRKIKIAVAVFVVIVSLAVATATLAFFLKKRSPTRLAEVNLEEGDTMVYRVDQKLEVRGADVQKGTITSVVGIQVLNKTSAEYWFVMKINITIKGGNVDVKGLRAMKTDLFLVRLQISDRLQQEADASGGSDETFELYGPHETDSEFIRYVYGILYQLLPVVKRDLYEDVDGNKEDAKNDRSPEKSPLLPGDVKMHRKANTSDNDAVFIKNHFNRSDLVNVSSEIDMDMTYTDYAFINKSSGMVSESHAYLSEQLYFGEPIHTKSGSDVTMLDVSLVSNVLLIQDDSFYFGDTETDATRFRLFVKLTVPRSDPEVSVPDIEEPEWAENPSNASHVSRNGSMNAKQNLTQSIVRPVKRSRRSISSTVKKAWKQAEPVYLTIQKTLTVFKKKVIGITIEGYTKIWLTVDNPIKIGSSLHLKVGSKDLKILSKTFEGKEVKDGKKIQSGRKWGKTIGISVPVFFLRLGVDFSLEIIVNTNLIFPPGKNSLSPVQIALEVVPYAEITATIDGYVQVLALRAGVEGKGTLVRLSFPITFSYHEWRSPGKKWCLDRSIKLTALELSARIYYQWWKLFRGWGSKKTLYNFGKWNGISKIWQSPAICS